MEKGKTEVGQRGEGDEPPLRALERTNVVRGDILYIVILTIAWGAKNPATDARRHRRIRTFIFLADLLERGKYFRVTYRT